MVIYLVVDTIFMSSAACHVVLMGKSLKSVMSSLLIYQVYLRVTRCDCFTNIFKKHFKKCTDN